MFELVCFVITFEVTTVTNKIADLKLYVNHKNLETINNDSLKAFLK